MKNKQDLVLGLMAEEALNDVDFIPLQIDGETILNYSELYRIGRVLDISIPQVLKSVVAVKERTPRPRKPKVKR